MRPFQKIGTDRIACKKKINPENSDLLVINKLNMNVQSDEDDNFLAYSVPNVETSTIFEERNKFRRFSHDRSKQLKIGNRSMFSTTRQDWRNVTKNALIKYGKWQKTEDTIHSRKAQKFKTIFGNSKRQSRSYTCGMFGDAQSLQKTLITIRKQTLHSFNEQSIRIIAKIQKQAGKLKTAQEFKTRNKIQYKTSQSSRKEQVSYTKKGKPQAYRPWSRSNSKQQQQQNEQALCIFP